MLYDVIYQIRGGAEMSGLQYFVIQIQS